MQTKPFNLQDYSFKDARTLVFRRNVPLWQRTLNQMAILLLFAAIFGGLFGLGRAYFSDRDLIFMIGATYAIALWLSLFTVFRQHAALRRHPLYSGATSVCLTDDAVIFTSQEASLKVAYGAVQDVIEVKSGLIILVNGYSFIPAPTAAFQDKAEMTAFSAAVRTRIPVAKDLSNDRT